MNISEENHPFQRNKVLLIDDESNYSQELKSLLSDINLELIYASAGEEALSQFDKHAIVLALIDIDMPEMDGYNVAERICDRGNCEVPFIFMLSEGSKEVKLFNGHEKATYTFISKPLDGDAVTSKVKYFVEKYRHEVELRTTKEILKDRIADVEKAYSELKSFSYTVSHDLRSPLRIISGYSNILLEDYGKELDEGATKVVKTIVRNTRKMSLLIDELLNFAKLAQQDRRFEVVDMQAKFEEIFEEMTEHIDRRSIKLNINDIRPAFVDHTLIRRLITNLLGNAIKYSSPKGEAIVEVGGMVHENEYVYYVKDNGVGFDMNYKDKIFGVFQRLHKESEFEGTGIGLAIVHKVIEHHGGRIWVESKLDEGTTFYFTLEKEMNAVAEMV